MNKEEILIDVIPVYKDEMYPPKESIWHFTNNSNVPREIKLSYMFMEITQKFVDCDCIIILEHGKVLEILRGGNTHE